MQLDKLLSISKKPGLYKLVTRTRNGFVAESLIDGKRMAVNFSNNVSLLSDISIYTLGSEVSLAAVFEKIYTYESGEQTRVSPKASKADLESYFFNVLPDYDEDRVYASDIKKLVSWYNILKQHNLLSQLISASESEEE